MEYVEVEQLLPALVERERSRLKNFLMKRNFERDECLHYVMFEGNVVFVTITRSKRPPGALGNFSLIRMYYVDEFGIMKSFSSQRGYSKGYLQFVQNLQIEEKRAIEDENKRVEKLLVGSFLINQTTEGLRLTLLIEMGLVMGSLQHLAKRVVQSHCFDLNQLPLPSAIIAYLKQ